MTFTFLPVHQIRHKKLWCQKKTGLKWQKHLKLISMYSVSLHNTKCIVSHFEHFWQHLKNNLKPSEELKGECVRVCFRRRVLNNRLSLTVWDATGWQASHSWPVLHGEVCKCVCVCVFEEDRLGVFWLIGIQGTAISASRADSWNLWAVSLCSLSKIFLSD